MSSRRKLRERFTPLPELAIPGAGRNPRRFVPVPDWLLAIPMNERRRRRIVCCYSHLWLAADWQTHRARPGRRRLAENSGLSLRTVDRALADLRRLGLIATRRRCRRTAELAIRHRPAWLRRMRAKGTDPRIAQVATRKRTRRKTLRTATSHLVHRAPLLEKTRSADPRDPVSALRIRPEIPAQSRAASVACPHYVTALVSQLRHADSGTIIVLEALRRRGLAEVAFATAGEALAHRRSRPDRPRLTNDAGYVVAALQQMAAAA